MERLLEHLHKIAEMKSDPFCYQCYAVAPTGYCATCGTDDLMRELPGVGCEYGTDWIIHRLLREHLSPVNTVQAFEEMMKECYPEKVKIGWIEFDTSFAIQMLDLKSWNMAHDEYIDHELEVENLLTFDNGTTYYWLWEVERFIESVYANA